MNYDNLQQQAMDGGHTFDPKSLKPAVPRDYHEEVLKIIMALVDLNPQPNTENFDLLDVLSDAIVKYETKYYPIGEEDEVNAKMLKLSGVRLTTPESLVPLYQYRERASAAWHDITKEDYVAHMKSPKSYLVYRTLYRAWE